MTEQSLMITTNEQPCNNQQQNSEVTHQYYLDSSEYELKMTKKHAGTYQITLQPVDEEYIHKYLTRVAMFCLTMIDKESLRYMHNVYGTFSDVERCNSLIVAFKEMQQKTKYLGNSEILRLATLPNSKNQYLG